MAVLLPDHCLFQVNHDLSVSALTHRKQWAASMNRAGAGLDPNATVN
jgi:hypothetical protein